MDLGGQFAGWISSIEGGHATSDVVAEKLGADMIVHKHLAGVKYEEITVNCGTAMSKAFYTWIQNSMDRKHTRNDGAIITADYDQNEMARLNFFHALITEVGFPACDAASKDAAKMSVKFSPEYTRMVTKKGSAVQAPIGKGEQKKWMPSNFRLKIDGLDTPCKNINKIEALTIKQKVVEDPCGEVRDYQKVPASIEYPNLVVTFSEAFADDVYKWHEDFVINGNNGQDKEKGGSLEFLTPDLKTTLFTLTFAGLGIFKCTPEKVEAASENTRRVKAEMYCEQVTFAAGSGSIFA
ncbi:MAG TPA: phage tail protein [Polyangia bacterium]